jgi:ubiquinone biosynthesis protein UbiJ
VRHRTVASLGRRATPEEAIAATRRNLRRLRTRLGMLEPLAQHSERRGEQVDRLRSRIASLTQRLERLQTLQDRARG